MTDQPRTLLQEALALPDRERADLATELLASLERAPADDPAAVEAAWADELQRRARKVAAEDDPGLPWDAVRTRVQRRLRAQ